MAFRMKQIKSEQCVAIKRERSFRFPIFRQPILATRTKSEIVFRILEKRRPKFFVLVIETIKKGSVAIK